MPAGLQLPGGALRTQVTSERSRGRQRKEMCPGMHGDQGVAGRHVPGHWGDRFDAGPDPAANCGGVTPDRTVGCGPESPCLRRRLGFCLRANRTVTSRTSATSPTFVVGTTACRHWSWSSVWVLRSPFVFSSSSAAARPRKKAPSRQPNQPRPRSDQ